MQVYRAARGSAREASRAPQFGAVTSFVDVTLPQVVVTVAVNGALVPGASVRVAGETVTPRIRSAAVTAAVAVELGDAWLVATTWYVPAAAGAV